MKKLFIPLFCLLASVMAVAQTPFPLVNTVSPHTNIVTYTGQLQQPGVSTNQATLVNTNNTYFGDAFPVAFGRVNFALNYLWNFLQTNVFAGDGGGVSGNFIRTTNGTGLDLTITDNFTIVDPDPYFTIGIWNPTNTLPTNWSDGYFPADPYCSLLTNDAGFSVVNSYPPAWTNYAGPYASTNINFPLLVNGYGWLALPTFTVTNVSGPYFFATDQTQTNGGWLTNAAKFVVLTGGLCPNPNGPYYPAPQFGPNAMTNHCGNVVTMTSIITNATNLTIAITSITANNTNGFSLILTNLDNAYTVFLGHELFGSANGIPTVTANLAPTAYLASGNNSDMLVASSGATGPYSYNLFHVAYSEPFAFVPSVTITTNWNPGWPPGYGVDGPSIQYANAAGFDVCCGDGEYSGVNYLGLHVTQTVILSYSSTFALYRDSQWEFYWATNVVFKAIPPSDSITINGNYYMLFTVAAPRMPQTNTVYTASDGSSVTFNGGPVPWSAMQYGILPGNAPVNFVDIPTPPNTNTIPQPGPIVPCNTYLIAQVGGVEKYLQKGTMYWSLVHDINQSLGYGFWGGPFTNQVYIAGNGTATVTMFNTTAFTFVWSDPAWVPFATNGIMGIPPPLACSLQPMGLPATLR